jgi:hypothetical protein
LEEIRRQLERHEISVDNAIVKSLPLLKEIAPEETILWLVSELQGYGNALEFYQRQSSASNLPQYRVVPGSLKLLDEAGALHPLKHPFASRGAYFLSAPAAWLEQFVGVPGDTAVAECRELTSFLSSGVGTVVCEFPKTELLRVLNDIRQHLIMVMAKADGLRKNAELVEQDS